MVKVELKKGIWQEEDIDKIKGFMENIIMFFIVVCGGNVLIYLSRMNGLGLYLNLFIMILFILSIVAKNRGK